MKQYQENCIKAADDMLGNRLLAMYRVFCGGNYNNTATNCRSANRNPYVPANVNANVGFRVVFPL